MEYDALNRLKKVTSVDGVTVAEYVYDADNRRMAKTVSNGGLPGDASLNGTTRYYYLGWRVLEERDGSGNIQRQYTYGNYLDEVWTIDGRDGVTVAQLNDGSGSNRHFAHNNTLYHIYGLTDEDGNLVEAYQYDAYGNATIFTDGDDGDSIVNFNSNDDNDNKWSSVNNPYQYTGQRYDPETYWMYYKNRYYSSALGRFISRDPIGYDGGINLYKYCSNNSINRIDPSGLDYYPWHGFPPASKHCNGKKGKKQLNCDWDEVGDCIAESIATQPELTGSCLLMCIVCRNAPSLYNPGCYGCAACAVGVTAFCIAQHCEYE